MNIEQNEVTNMGDDEEVLVIIHHYAKLRQSERSESMRVLKKVLSKHHM